MTAAFEAVLRDLIAVRYGSATCSERVATCEKYFEEAINTTMIRYLQLYQRLLADQ